MQQRAFSILELVIALALFMMVLVMLGSYASFSLANLASGQAMIEAEALNQEAQAIVGVVARRDWNSLNALANTLQYDLGQWNVINAASPEQIGIYQRSISLSPVCRDGLQAVVDCSLGTIDAGTYRLAVMINWPSWLGAQEVRQETYIANWR